MCEGDFPVRDVVQISGKSGQKWYEIGQPGSPILLLCLHGARVIVYRAPWLRVDECEAARAEEEEDA